jgi:aspartyl protease family protein
MMNRVLMIAGLAALSAATVPNLASRYLNTAPSTETSPPVAKSADRPLPAAAGAREVVLPAGAGGHFNTLVDMNGRSISGMIDTGATVVAINQSMARQIGLSPSALDYSIPVSTANGRVTAAAVSLKRVKVGSIAVDNVQAMVLPDTALSEALVGMSFLNRLSSFSVEGGALRLRR